MQAIVVWAVLDRTSPEMAAAPPPRPGTPPSPVGSLGPGPAGRVCG